MFHMKLRQFFTAILGILILFNLSKASGPDTVVVPMYLVNGDVYLFPIPSPENFDTLLKKVEIIVKHENKSDQRGYGYEERKIFLSYLKKWKDKPSEILTNVLFGISKYDNRFYSDRWELVRLALLGDLYTLQSFLIATYWGMHLNHSDGLFTPIWSKEECDAFLASNLTANTLVFKPTPAAIDSSTNQLANSKNSETTNQKIDWPKMLPVDSSEISQAPKKEETDTTAADLTSWF
jgi:hypothetical protein